MADDFTHDIFLSHSSKDKPVVHAVAERLRADGLRVWLDEWELKPGSSIPAKIEEGLEHSRVLVLCMSADAFGSDWAQLEAGTFRFRDPLNQERRFITLRLDGAPIPGSLAQFLYVNWLPQDREQEYPKLLAACRPLAQPPVVDVREQAPRKQVAEMAFRLDHTARIWAYVFSPDGTRALTGAGDKTVRLWDVETGRCLRVFEGHTDDVYHVVWSTDQRRALSGSKDKTLRLWNVETGHCLRVFEGHRGSIEKVALNADRCRALSASGDHTVRLWNAETGHCLRVFEGHAYSVGSVAWSPTNAAPFPVPSTIPCGCGTWRLGAACACSKVTRTAYWT